MKKAIVSRIKYPIRLLLTAFLITVTIFVLIFQIVSGINGSIAFTRNELSGLEYIEQVVRLIAHIQRHRGLSSGYLSGDNSLKMKITVERAHIEKVIKDIDTIDTNFGRTLNISEQWDGLKIKWQSLKNRGFDITPEESFIAHTTLIAEILALITYTADTSNLTLDSDIASNHLISIVVTQIPNLIERLGQLRGMSTGIIARRQLAADEKTRLIIIEAKVKDLLEGVWQNTEKVITENPDLKPKLGNLSQGISIAAGDVINLLNDKIIAAKYDIASDIFYNKITGPIDDCIKLHMLSISALKSILSFRIKGQSRKLNFSLGIAVAGVGLLIYLGWWTYISIGSAVRRLELSTDELALTNKLLQEDIAERITIEQHNLELKKEIEERLGVEKQLEHALSEQRELNQIKSQFVSTVSHEFRTPLSVIASSSEIIEKHRDRMPEEKLLLHFQRIQNGVRRMTGLLNDILTIGRYSAGKVEFHPQPLELENFCIDLIEAVRMQTKCHHAIRLNYSSNLKSALLDEKLLQQILLNLLTNAVKYSPNADEVELEVCHTGERVVFIVRDHGIGIPEGDIGKIFEPFHRAENTGTIQGTGLGLAIVKEAVNAHRGEIGVTSQAGAGSTFTVRLPLSGREAVVYV